MKQSKPSLEPEAEPILEVPSEEENEYQEKWQRALAETENLRKRHEQERVNWSKFALNDFLSELLPVLDNFDRATEHVPAELQNSPWVTGILYIQKNLLDTLARRGVEEIPVKVGDHLDPAKHEAIGVEEKEGEEDQVTKVVNKGYMIHDRVLRPVQVFVSQHMSNNKK